MVSIKPFAVVCYENFIDNDNLTAKITLNPDGNKAYFKAKREMSEFGDNSLEPEALEVFSKVWITSRPLPSNCHSSLEVEVRFSRVRGAILKHGKYLLMQLFLDTHIKCSKNICHSFIGR